MQAMMGSEERKAESRAEGSEVGCRVRRGTRSP